MPVAARTTGRIVGVDQDVGAVGHRTLGRAVEHRDVLAGEHEGGRAVVVDGEPPGVGVSLASAGRKTRRPGMARSDATCSTGWWVGPSSPTPTESWVHAKTTFASASAARRTAGRM